MDRWTDQRRCTELNLIAIPQRANNTHKNVPKSFVHLLEAVWVGLVELAHIQRPTRLVFKRGQLKLPHVP